MGPRESLIPLNSGPAPFLRTSSQPRTRNPQQAGAASPSLIAAVWRVLPLVFFCHLPLVPTGFPSVRVSKDSFPKKTY